MKSKKFMRKELSIVQGAEVEDALRRAVQNALLIHKRAGNAIATWDGEKVVIVPADDIVVDESNFVRQRGQQEA